MIKKKSKKLTQTSFLIYLYKMDPLIANNTAYTLLKKEFPKTKTTQRTLTSSWKYILRKRGIKIPFQRHRKGSKK